MLNTPERLINYLRVYAQRYPDAWKKFELFRQGKKELGGWPDWCWCPLIGANTIVGNGEAVSLDKILDVAILGALASWRVTQGIYRFDRDFFKALWETELDDRLPIEVFYRLPEWCVYIEVPENENYIIWDVKLFGFFVHLEWDVNTGRPELRYVLDMENGLIVGVFHLHHSTISESIRSVIQEAEKHVKLNMPEDLFLKAQKALIPLLSIILYLCSQTADIYDLQGKKEKPSNPRPKKTKKGMKIFPASEKTIWLVGYRIGPSLRRVYREYNISERPLNKIRSSPRPHIRRAHWHSYWIGPRDGERKIILKWLPPSLVSGEQIIPTIRWVRQNVKGKNRP